MIIIKVPNDVFLDSERALVPDELLVLMFVLKNRNIDYDILVSVDLLSYLLKFKKGNESENKSYIRDLLLSLNSKKYLSFNIPPKFDYYIALCVNVINVEKGYCGVSSEVFDAIINEGDITQSKLKLYLYTYIHCYGETGRQVNYSRLSDMCRYFKGNKKYSVRTIFDIVNKMDGIYIYKFSGEREDGDVHQNSNTYFTKLGLSKVKEYSDHLDKKSKKKKPRNDDEIVFLIWYDDITVEKLKMLAEGSNWQKYDLSGKPELLTQEDYDIYRTCEDENVNIGFVRKCRAGIKKMKNNPDENRYDWEEMEREYQKGRDHMNSV